MNGVGRNRRIRLLVKENLKRAEPRERYFQYQDGMTVQAYIDAVKGIGQREQNALDDLCWDQNQNFIRLEA
jgi:hypothetical protein